MPDAPREAAPLPEDWSARDSHDSFFEYIALVREEQRQGKPLPKMFRSTREEGGR